MKKVAWVFPSQGSQYEGMGQNLYEESELAQVSSSGKPCLRSPPEEELTKQLS